MRRIQFIEELLEHTHHGLAAGPRTEAPGCGRHKWPMSKLQSQLSYPTLTHAHNSTPQPTASFQTTVNGLATVAARFHTLRDGELVLYKRPHSRVWQCRYKLFANEWHRQTTRRTVLADAVRVAGELYDEARFRERMGLAPARKSFSQIAQLTVEEMRRDLAAGTGKKIYDDYIQVIECYLVPFFGDRQLQTLKHKDIAEFEVWRNAKMGKRPKSSTLMTYVSAFTRVCKRATERGWLSESVVLPLMSRKGEKGGSKISVRTNRATAKYVISRTLSRRLRSLSRRRNCHLDCEASAYPAIHLYRYGAASLDGGGHAPEKNALRRLPEYRDSGRSRGVDLCRS